MMENEEYKRRYPSLDPAQTISTTLKNILRSKRDTEENREAQTRTFTIMEREDVKSDFFKRKELKIICKTEKKKEKCPDEKSAMKKRMYIQNYYKQPMHR